jgi:hypothetical protein
MLMIIANNNIKQNIIGAARKNATVAASLKAALIVDTNVIDSIFIPIIPAKNAINPIIPKNISYIIIDLKIPELFAGNLAFLLLYAVYIP